MHRHRECKDQVVAGLISGDDICKLREAVCVQVEKVYDHCKEKDCVEDAVVDFVNPDEARELIRTAKKVRTKSAEVESVCLDIDEVQFKKGFYTVDIRYKIKVVIEFCSPLCRPGVQNPLNCTQVGYVYFGKTVFLFGSEGNVKIFKTMKRNDEDDMHCCELVCEQSNLPTAKVEVADPLPLNTKIIKVCPRPLRGNDDDEDDVESESNCHCPHPPILPRREVVVTIGLFSIIKLVRYVQLLIPAFNFCYPNKECISSTDEDPCELFDTIDFPMDEFFPPQKFDFPGAEEEEDRLRDAD